VQGCGVGGALCAGRRVNSFVEGICLSFVAGRDMGFSPIRVVLGQHDHLRKTVHLPAHNVQPTPSPLTGSREVMIKLNFAMV
jgi:hypothetical protein